MDASQPPQTNRSTPSSLEDEVARLQRTVALLAQRLDRLERQPPATPVAVRSSARRLESRFGLTLVNRAGALTLAIGIIFFFKYAVDNRWIAAEGRVWVGVCAGLLLLGAAEWFRSRSHQADAGAPDTRIFTQGLAGCGLATIYAAIYAAFAYYDLIIPIAGWLLLVLVSAFALLLSIRYTSVAIAALGLAGGLLTPMLLHNRATPWWFDLLYLSLLSATALAIAVRRRWATLLPWVAGGALLSAAVSFQTHHPGWFALFACLLAGAHFAVAARPEPDQPLARYATFTAHGALLVAAMRSVALLTNSETSDHYSLTSALESVLLGVYGIVMLAYGMLRDAWASRTLGLVLLGIVIAKLYLWDIWQLNKFYRISAFVALGILLLCASYVYSRFRSRTSE